MRNKVILICLMVLTLILASCSEQTKTEGAVTTLDESQTVTVGSEEQQVDTNPGTATTVGEDPNKPKYGGELTYVTNVDITGFDPLYTRIQDVRACLKVNNYLIHGDWGKGLAGTGETDWMDGAVSLISLMTGSLAESWELPDNTTIIAHIRKGVRFGLDPNSEASRLVNGREFTANDAVWSFERDYSLPTTVNSITFPVGERPWSFTALDKYTVEIKVPENNQGRMVFVCLGYTWMLPHEVAEKYGDFKDWRNLVGTGPFFLRDVLTGSVTTYVRNPNYFLYDPIHPENRLPYVDTLKELIISDTSTQLAAFRTGKIDYISGIEWEDAEILLKSTPEIQSSKKIVAGSVPWFRVDKEDLPFKDIRVRQAMNLAVNKQEILDAYYHGNAVMLGIPWPPTPTYSSFYTPIDQQPPEVQELFTYNPEKAKQLLAAAGYPDGFKTEIICNSADADFVSLIKNYFSAINVDMEIQTLETGAFFNVSRARSHEEMIFKGVVEYGNPTNLNMVNKTRMDCPSFYDEPWVMDAYNNISLVVGKDEAELARLLKEAGPKMLATAVGVWLPSPYMYNLWWPWLQNYHGEMMVGYGNQNLMHQYLWVDTALKKSMGY